MGFEVHTMSLKLYTNPICPFAHRAWMTLLEKGIAFETVLVPLSGEIAKAKANGATSGQWAGKSFEELVAIKENYKKEINATGEVPTLVHDGNIITEADVVSEYIDDAFPAEGTPLFPKDALQRSKIRHMLKILSGANGGMA